MSAMTPASLRKFQFCASYFGLDLARNHFTVTFNIQLAPGEVLIVSKEEDMRDDKGTVFLPGADGVYPWPAAEPWVSWKDRT